MLMHQQRISFSRKRFLEEAANRLFLGIAVVFYGMFIVQSCSVQIEDKKQSCKIGV